MEKVFLEKGFKDLKQIMEGIYNVWLPNVSSLPSNFLILPRQVKIQYNMLEDFVLKYSWCKSAPFGLVWC